MAHSTEFTSDPIAASSTEGIVVTNDDVPGQLIGVVLNFDYDTSFDHLVLRGHNLATDNYGDLVTWTVTVENTDSVDPHAFRYCAISV